MIKKIVQQLHYCVGLVMNTASAVHAIEDVKIIDRTQTEHFLQNGAVFIDNRPEYKFSLGHIEGAINLPYFIANDPSNKMTKENLAKAIGDNDLVVFYCTGMERAYHALKQAQQWGITAEMYWYKNGFEEWKMFHPSHLD
ncbi:MAG: rhodanese-like domain-containing protein [Desulfobulbus sp.]